MWEDHRRVVFETDGIEVVETSPGRYSIYVDGVARSHNLSKAGVVLVLQRFVGEHREEDYLGEYSSRSRLLGRGRRKEDDLVLDDKFFGDIRAHERRDGIIV